MQPVSALRLILAACLALLPASLAFAGGAVIREQGAIYLEDFTQQPVRIPITAEAPIFFHSDLGQYLGTLRKGQILELQAVRPDAYRVRGFAQQGQVAGWVSPASIPALKKEFIENLKQNAARRDAVAALIARNEVAVNMTPDEVIASLGKPSRKIAKQDAAGREETWEFIRYERVPQTQSGYDQFGRFVTSVVYVKVPAGKLSVTFDNNLVSSLEQTEGTLDRDARPKLVPAPLVFAN